MVDCRSRFFLDSANQSSSFGDYCAHLLLHLRPIDTRLLVGDPPKWWSEFLEHQRHMGCAGANAFFGKESLLSMSQLRYMLLIAIDCYWLLLIARLCYGIAASQHPQLMGWEIPCYVRANSPRAMTVWSARKLHVYQLSIFDDTRENINNYIYIYVFTYVYMVLHILIDCICIHLDCICIHIYFICKI